MRPKVRLISAYVRFNMVCLTARNIGKYTLFEYVCLYSNKCLLEPVSPLKPKTLGSQIKTSPVKSTFYGTFSIYPVDNRKTFKCPLQMKFRY